MLGNFMFFLSSFNDANVNFTVYTVSKLTLKSSPLSFDGIWESGGSTQLHSFLTLELDGGRGVSFTARPLYPRAKLHQFTLTRRLVTTADDKDTGKEKTASLFKDHIVNFREKKNTNRFVVIVITIILISQ